MGTITFAVSSSMTYFFMTKIYPMDMDVEFYRVSIFVNFALYVSVEHSTEIPIFHYFLYNNSYFFCLWLLDLQMFKFSFLFLHLKNQLSNINNGAKSLQLKQFDKMNVWWCVMIGILGWPDNYWSNFSEVFHLILFHVFLL